MKKKRKVIKVKRRVRSKKLTTWQLLIKFAFVFVIFGGILILSLIVTSNKPVSKIASTDSLQLDTFTPTPTPSPSPTPNQPPNNSCGLANGVILIIGSDSNGNCCIEDGPGKASDACCPGVPRVPFAGGFPGIPPETEFWCNAKPVIYLYPEKPTLVSVSVKVPGKLTVSIPTYPFGGWKEVLAKPNGELLYRGNTYSELFYESSITPVIAPTKGFVIKSNDLANFLKDFTRKLGFKENESNELVSYWIPRLKELHSPYVFVSLFDPVSKDKIDHVEITPKPNTFIAHILYFKALEKNLIVEPILLPQAPQRIGFTAVEWGGIID